jgi:protein involved in polysaccharide export with SLBB domain
MKSLLLFCVLASLLLPTAVLRAQPPAATAKEEKKPVAYRITRGDILSIGVLGESELSAAQKRVEAVGTINLAYIGDVRLVGLTIKEAQETIEKAYQDNRILRNPTVTVIVEQYQPRVVRISGYVNSPGQINIPADSETTLLELIFKANGLQETANGRRIRITRTMPDGSYKVFEKDVESAIKAKAKNIGDAAFLVEPDDVIYVPQNII